MNQRNDSDRLDRRQALAALGTALAASVAGCSDSGGGSDVPDFEVDEDAPGRLRLLTVDFPDEITYGETFQGEVAFGNAGGEPIDTAASVSVERLTADDVSPQSAEINSDGLESGESRSHSIGQFTAAAAGEFRLEPGTEFDSVADTVDPEFSAVPMTGQTGEQVTTTSDLRFTLTGVEYTPAILTRSGDSFDLRDTLEDRIIAMPQITIENAGSEGTTIDEDAFSVTAGSRVSDVQPVAYEAPHLRDQHVNPGESMDGWIAVAIDRGDAGSFELGFDSASAEPPSDITIQVDGASELPAFELVDTQVPAEFQPGDQEFSFTVENTGDAPGTFQGHVEYLYTEDPGFWNTQDPDTWYADFGEGMTAEIPPGETRTVSEMLTYDSDIDIEYRLNPFGFEFTVAASD